MPRTHAQFRATGFNRSEDRDNFINPGNYGDDLALWLMQALRERGYAVGESEEEGPGQEDFGWFFGFTAGDVEHTCLVIRNEDVEDGWFVIVERNAGCLASLFGGSSRGIRPEAVMAIHEALVASDRVSDLTWQPKSASKRDPESGAPTPVD